MQNEVRCRSPADPFLLHATTENKARAISMVGFRIGPKTKRATGYCARNDWDCMRDEAYKESERVHEETRRKYFPARISRQNAVFFYPKEGHYWVDDPGAVIQGDDDYGRPIYDFGFGKDTLFVVDSKAIPCKCGVGDGTKSDNVFNHFYTEYKGGQRLVERGRDPEEKSAEFWQTAKEYVPETFDVWGEQDLSDDYQPEVWCPCAIPRSAIVEKHDKNNPIQEYWRQP